jgi:uncharacterized surface protein with fasciclin (FAS1) repeats
MMNRRKSWPAVALVAAAAFVASPAMADDGFFWGYCKPAAITHSPDDIVTTAVKAGSFQTLAALLTQAGLVTTLQGTGPFTVFAPTDAAFNKIPPSVLSAIGQNALAPVLTYHVVAGRKDLRFADETVTLKTVQGEKLFARVYCDKGTAKIRVNNSNVVVTPIAATNGIIYVIDSVLLPQF